MKKLIVCLMAMMGVLTISAQQKVENKDAQVAINNINNEFGGKAD